MKELNTVELETVNGGFIFDVIEAIDDIIEGYNCAQK